MPSGEITFTSFDGLRLSGTIEMPSEEIRGRALLIHGMTADREEWGFYGQLSTMFSRIGIANLRMDYRCHGAENILPTTDLSLAGIMNDISAGHAALTTAVPGAHLPTFLVGASFGAGVSASWVDCNPDKVSVLILCYPVLNYVADFDKTSLDWREQLRNTGTFDYVGLKLSRGIANEAMYIPSERAMALPKVPILVFHGDCDNDVPIEHSRHFANLSDKTTLEEVPGADHGFVVPGDVDAVEPKTQMNYDFVFERLLARCQEEFRG